MNDESHTTASSSAKGQSDRRVFLGWLRIVFPKVVAMIYTAGTVIHILRLIFRFQLTNMPYEIDWVPVRAFPVNVFRYIRILRRIRGSRRT